MYGWMDVCMYACMYICVCMYMRFMGESETVVKCPSDNNQYYFFFFVRVKKIEYL